MPPMPPHIDSDLAERRAAVRLQHPASRLAGFALVAGFVIALGALWVTSGATFSLAGEMLMLEVATLVGLASRVTHVWRVGREERRLAAGLLHRVTDPRPRRLVSFVPPTVVGACTVAFVVTMASSAWAATMVDGPLRYAVVVVSALAVLQGVAALAATREMLDAPTVAVDAASLIADRILRRSDLLRVWNIGPVLVALMSTTLLGQLGRRGIGNLQADGTMALAVVAVSATVVLLVFELRNPWPVESHDHP